MQIPILNDFAVHTRLLIAMPLLFVAEMVIAPWLKTVVQNYITSGLILEKDLPESRRVIAVSARWKQSIVAGLVIFFLFFLSAIIN